MTKGGFELPALSPIFVPKNVSLLLIVGSLSFHGRLSAARAFIDGKYAYDDAG